MQKTQKKQKTLSPGAQLARLRWAKPDADRDQPRRAGKLGGRPATCACKTCPICVRRTKRQKKASARQ